MNDTGKTVLVIACVAAVLLFLLLGGGMATGATMSGGMMGAGRMGGLNWMWIPALLTLALCILLVFAIFRKK